MIRNAEKTEDNGLTTQYLICTLRRRTKLDILLSMKREIQYNKLKKFF